MKQVKAYINHYGAELLTILREPAAFDHPATWACIAAGLAVGAMFGAGVGALFQ